MSPEAAVLLPRGSHGARQAAVKEPPGFDKRNTDSALV